jgi:membrane-bound lytic murein transglycosylase A
MKMQFRLVSLAWLCLTLTACEEVAIKPSIPNPIANKPASCICKPETPAAWVPIPDGPNLPADKAAPVVKIPDYSLLKPASWSDISAFEQDDLSQAWPAWLLSCTALKTQAVWQRACDAANTMPRPSQSAIANYFKQYFTVYATSNVDGTDTGLITGYYEPLLRGSHNKTERYRYPLYNKPDDLITVDLSTIYPELANKRVRGRLTGNKVVPYLARGEIESENAPLSGRELLWVDDIVDLFFLQIQGSGLVQIETGEQVHVGYADQNGQPYQSIGRILIERGEITADKASMQGIKNWGRNNPAKLRELLNSNPSYVFFRELPAGLPGPIGALNTPILAERAVAIDPRFVPLGAPVFLATTYPNNPGKPLNRLMQAQDTGGAIKGGVRADFFWGAGEEAARQAGSMKQKGKIWVLLPKEFVLRPNDTVSNNK